MPPRLGLRSCKQVLTNFKDPGLKTRGFLLLKNNRKILKKQLTGRLQGNTIETYLNNKANAELTQSQCRVVQVKRFKKVVDMHRHRDYNRYNAMKIAKTFFNKL